MSNLLNVYENLNSREGFNRSLRHFKAVMGIIGDFEDNINLADALNDLLEQKRIEPSQVSSIVASLLVDKYGYNFRSYNIKNEAVDIQKIYEETKKWKAVDLFISYFHPELGLTPINPKNRQHWDLVKMVKKNELMIFFAGNFKDTIQDKLYSDALEKLLQVFEGKRIKTPPSFTVSTRKKIKTDPEKSTVKREISVEKTAVKTAPSAAALPAVAPPAKKKMTPLYSIPVTNELFHNGNVEAWKRIITSYKAKYSDLEVYIFYDGEKINDINTLFKWGKVKHGSSILISIGGETVKDVSKLQKYLRQGASPMFEAFLKFPVNTVLNLF